MVEKETLGIKDFESLEIAFFFFQIKVNNQVYFIFPGVITYKDNSSVWSSIVLHTYVKFPH